MLFFRFFFFFFFATPQLQNLERILLCLYRNDLFFKLLGVFLHFFYSILVLVNRTHHAYTLYQQKSKLFSSYIHGFISGSVSCSVTGFGSGFRNLVFHTSTRWRSSARNADNLILSVNFDGVSLKWNLCLSCM